MPGRESDRIVRPQAHDQRREGGGNAGGEQHAVDGHSGLAQNARVHDYHIGHGHERRKAANHFAANCGVIFSEMKKTIEQRALPCAGKRA